MIQSCGLFRMIRKRGGSGLAGVSMVVLATFSGCGSSDAPPIMTVFEVKGSVLLPNSKPLTGGKISFVRTELPLIVSSASIAPDGSFSLTTGDSGEGAPEGQYKVRIETNGPPPIARGGKVDPKILPFPIKYTDEDSSGLVVMVKAEPNQLQPFILK